VGNGGCTLMNIDATLTVLTNRYREDPAAFWSDLIVRHSRALRPMHAVLERLQRLLPRSRLVAWPLRQWEMACNPSRYGINNDLFWSFHAAKYLPTFRLAPVRDGLRFAFEAAPRRCFELNARQLPFGCHAWAKFDAAFWEPYLLRETAG
jgi:hypothetical protein